MVNVEVIKYTEHPYHREFSFDVMVGNERKTFQCTYNNYLNRFYLSKITVSDEYNVMKLEQYIENQINDYMRLFLLLYEDSSNIS